MFFQFDGIIVPKSWFYESQFFLGPYRFTEDTEQAFKNPPFFLFMVLTLIFHPSGPNFFLSRITAWKKQIPKIIRFHC